MNATGESPASETLSLRILLLTSLGHLLCHVGELAYVGLLPAVVREFEITVDRAALLAVPGIVMYGLGALPTGLLTDRHGSPRALHLYFSAVAISCLVIYFAPGPIGFGIGLTFLGAAISIYHPAGLAMLSLGCPNRGRAMGINGVAGSLGVAAGPSLGLFVWAWFSWRATYAVIGGLALIGLCCSLWARIELPSVEPAARKTRPPAKGALPLVAVLLLAMLVGGFNYRCLTTVLPAYLSGNAQAMQEPPATKSADQEGQPRGSVKDSGIVFFVLALGGIGQLAAGHLADRYRTSVLYATTVAITAPTALAIASTSLTTGTWLACVLAIFMFGQQPLENSLLAEVTPSKYRSTMYGLKFVLAFGLAATGTYVAGLVWRFQGAEYVFYLFAACAVLMALLAAAFALLWQRKSTAAPAR